MLATANFGTIRQLNSQFTLLALYEAELVGVEIDDAVWQSAGNYWLRMQNDDDSWGYRSSTLNQGFTSGYGTGNGLCRNCRVGDMFWRAAARAKIGENVLCCQGVDDSVRLSQGLNWLES